MNKEEFKEEYNEESIQHYLDDLASAQSTPGGGSASALSGAMAAALVSMVCRLTIGKTGYEGVQGSIENILDQTERLRARFGELLQEDIAAYGRLSSAYKMPRTTDEERAERAAAIQQQLVGAALVPLELVECAAKLALYCRAIAEIGNANVLSDIAVAAELARAAGRGGASMVRINLRSIKIEDRARELETRLAGALQQVEEYSRDAVSLSGTRRS